MGSSAADDAELSAISTISAAMATLPDQEVRRRVLSYIMARFLPEDDAKRGPLAPDSPTQPVAPRAQRVAVEKAELAGIAQLSEKGELRITIRDLKAKSALDGAVRLATVAIYAYEQLAGQRLSSRKALTPLLKQWRLYDGNTRARLAREKGILRDGDNLSLDAHAKRDAERFMEEIRNPQLKGTWKP